MGREMNRGYRKFWNQELQPHQNSLALSLLPLLHWLQSLTRLAFFLSLFYLFILITSTPNV